MVLLHPERESGAAAMPQDTRVGRHPWLGATAAVAVAALVALLVQRLSHPNLSVVFLCAVLAVAAVWGRWPSIYASLLSFVVFNVFFTPPLFTLRVADDGNVATLVFFLAIAALAGNLAARARTQMRLHRDGLQRMSRLFDFTHRLSATARADAVAHALASELANEFGGRVLVCLGEGVGAGAGTVAWRPAQAPGREEAEAAARDVLAGSAAPAGWSCLALDVAQRRLGAVCMDGLPRGTDRERLARNLCDQASVALERIRLAAELEQARVARETEQLRSALLASVSHDLRTPLAAIIGSASTLLELDARTSAPDRRLLLEGVVAQAGRLDRYIQNLLDMTRLGHGGIALQREWVDLGDVTHAAAERLRGVLPAQRLHVRVDADAALVNAHGALLEQAIVNLLDNAARFSPGDEPVYLEVRRDGAEVCIDVVDRGPGIPVEERSKVFDMFYRVGGADRAMDDAGTGLGLAICQGMVGAHGGRIEVLDGDGGRGTRMRIVLPAPLREDAPPRS